jgi:hypothetical protein
MSLFYVVVLLVVLLPQRLGFNCRTSCMGFVVGRVAVV